jgi:hypothetical protein
MYLAELRFRISHELFPVPACREYCREMTEIQDSLND